MNLVETLRGLWRRWYIVFPGIIIAALLAITAWFVIQPGYERSATQLLLPGSGSLPEEGGNPYLYIGGATQAADVLVTALGAENVLNEVSRDHPGTSVVVSRDPSTPGPVVLITVTAKSDAEAAVVLDDLVERTAVVLDDLQEAENVPAEERISVRPLTIDETSTLQQRSRLVNSAGIGLAGVMLSLVLAAMIDGLQQRKRRSNSPQPVADRSGLVPASLDASEESGGDEHDGDPTKAAPETERVPASVDSSDVPEGTSWSLREAEQHIELEHERAPTPSMTGSRTDRAPTGYPHGR